MSYTRLNIVPPGLITFTWTKESIHDQCYQQSQLAGLAATDKEGNPAKVLMMNEDRDFFIENHVENCLQKLSAIFHMVNKDDITPYSVGSNYSLKITDWGTIKNVQISNLDGLLSQAIVAHVLQQWFSTNGIKTDYLEQYGSVLIAISKYLYVLLKRSDRAVSEETEMVEVISV